MPPVLGLAVAAWDFVGLMKECSARGYSSDRYLAYCDSERFGGYEHGAYFLETEPAAVESLKKADVLFLGNSRMQFAFSTESALRAFKDRATSGFHLLGFAYGENYLFPLAVMSKLKITPKALIVSVDDRFFLKTQSPAAFFVTAQRGARNNYEAKILKQLWHQRLCSESSPIRSLCGELGSIFRSRATGFWYTKNFRKSEDKQFLDAHGIDAKTIETLIAGGKDFLARVGVRKDCIIFVSTPLQEWSSDSGAELARRLGTTFVSGPERRWVTIDGSHLVPESAEAWSGEVLEKIKPLLARCGA